MLKLEKPVAIRLTKDDAKSIKDLAKYNYCTVSTYCRTIIKTHLKKIMRFHFKGIKQDREESAHDRKKRLPDLIK